MTQEQILDYLESNQKRSHSCREISVNLNLNYGNVSRCLAKLRQYNLVNFYYKANMIVYFHKIKDEVKGINEND